jgi:hypothetical protein
MIILLLSCSDLSSVRNKYTGWSLDKGETQAICYVQELEEGDLIFTEFMIDNENLYDFRGEWIEIYNTTNIAIDIYGLRIERMYENDYTNEGRFVVEDHIIADPQSTIVFSHRYFPHVNGGLENVDYLYNYNEMKLTNIERIRMVGGGTILDDISWDKSWPHKVGRSLVLDYDKMIRGGSNSVNHWCYAVNPYGSYGEFGTPNQMNPQCLRKQDLVEGDLVITEIMHNPSDTYDWSGEWFEVFNSTEYIIDINGLQIRSKNDRGSQVIQTVDYNLYRSDDPFIEPGEYFIFGSRYESQDNGNIPVDFKYNRDKLILDSNDSIEIRSGSTVIDRVEYDSSRIQSVPGKSISLSGEKIDSILNDSDFNWCNSESYSDWDNGIFYNFSSPKMPNLTCLGEDRDQDGYTVSSGDCDDLDSSVYPGAVEICDSIDNDCDGKIDAHDEDVYYRDSDALYIDLDADGFGSLDYYIFKCESEDCSECFNFSSIPGDCNDNDPLIFYGAEEIWYDGIDQNCQGGSDFDKDGDGEDSKAFGGSDCDDDNFSINTRSVEILGDGIDNNCDGSLTDINDDNNPCEEEESDLNCEGDSGLSYEE